MSLELTVEERQCLKTFLTGGITFLNRVTPAIPDNEKWIQILNGILLKLKES